MRWQKLETNNEITLDGIRMKKIDTQSLLKKMINAGIECSVNIPTNTGVIQRVCSVDEILLYLEHPRALYALHFDISEGDYAQCVAEEYSVKCAGITVKGFACQATVKGGFCVSPTEWAAMKGQYCEIHGDADY